MEKSFSLSTRSFLRSCLEFECGTFVDAADGEEAIVKAREIKPDLIILDPWMRRMNDLDTAAALPEIVPDAPIILFTLHKDFISDSMAHELGITSVVSKTGSVDDLSVEVQRLLAVA